MTRILRCRDLGPDCDFVARGETDDAIMEQAAGHARTAHGMERVPEDMERRARASIRDEPLERHEPPYTTTGGITAPKFGSAGSGGLEYERLPERHGPDGAQR
jgi:predicted small metal-binding protein